MKILLNILALILLIAGIVWILQGINILGGSSMTGQSQWAIAGGIAILVAIILGAFTSRIRISSTKK